MYGCGLRISEALSIDSDYSFINEFILIKGKGGKERQVPILPLVRNAIKDYLDKHNPSKDKQGSCLLVKMEKNYHQK